MSRPLTEKAPTYPSSSQRAKDWGKLEAQIKKDEKDNKEDMGDANAYVHILISVCILYLFFVAFSNNFIEIVMKILVEL
jgi:hypothetical protein